MKKNFLIKIKNLINKIHEENNRKVNKNKIDDNIKLFNDENYKGRIQQ